MLFSFRAPANTELVANSPNYTKVYQAACHQINIDVEEAIKLGKESLTIAEKLGDNSKKLKSLQLLFNFYLNNSRDLEVATNYLSKIKLIPQKSLSAREQASIYDNEAKFYMATHHASEAVKAIFKQMEALRGIDAPLEMAQANFALGQLENSQNNHKEAINYYKSAIQFFQQANQTTGLARAYDALGASYGQLDKLTLNIYYDSLALSIADTLNAPFIKTSILLNYSNAYKRIGQVDKSLHFTNKAISLAKKATNQKHLATAYNQLGSTYELKNEPYKAVFFYRKANEIAETLQDKALLMNSYEWLHKFSLKQGKYKEAYNYLQKLTLIKDNPNNNKIKEQLISQKLEYLNNQKQYEYLSLLSKENEQANTIKKQKMKSQALFVITFLSVILAILLYNSYKSKLLYNKRLEAEVKARTGDLKVANNELQIINGKLKQSNLELERFAYIASHDLKSPLRNIVSFLGLCKRRLKDKSYIKIEEYIQFATDNANQMYTLIQDVLEYSRVNNQSMTGWEKEVDLNEILASVIYNIDSDIKHNNAVIQTCPLPVVKGSRVHLLQLFQNLISNGIKYNKNSLPKVLLSHEENTDEHIIQIKDNGIGIEEQYHEKVFDMFNRLHTQANYSGTGLGLSICKKVVQDMKGRIWLESEPGIGTTFFVSIPKMPVQVMADQN